MANGFKSGGRQAGTPNKATTKARQAIADFVDGNTHRLQDWLDKVAGGVQVPVLDDDGMPKMDAEGNPVMRFQVLPDPAAAFKMVMDIAEYHVPKLARTEVSGPDGGPVQVGIVKFSDLPKA